MTINTKENSSEVMILEQHCNNGNSRYAVYYKFGKEFDTEMVKKLNILCDTIAYREHYRAHLGKYPDNNFRIHFKTTGREHTVSFLDTPSYVAQRTADQISRILNVQCDCSFIKFAACT